MTDEYRVQFDADVSFANGGGLRTEGFRLDIDGADISDDDLAAYFVAHLGLLLVSEVRLTNKQILREPHMGSRGRTAQPAGAGRRHSGGAEPPDPPRHGHVPRPARPGDHRPPEPGRLARPLRAGHGVPHRTDLDGGQHGHVPGRAVAPVRRWRRPGRRRARAPGRPARAGGPAARVNDRDRPRCCSHRTTCGARRCCCTPDGTGTGVPTPTAPAGIRTSPRTRPKTWPPGAPTLVGIDSVSVDDLTDGDPPRAHDPAPARGDHRRAPARTR